MHAQTPASGLTAQDFAHTVSSKVSSAVSTATASLPPRPRLRGWIHVGVTPLALAASIVLTALAPTASRAWASGVFLACSLMLFGMSALYHRIPWGPRGLNIMRRADHSNIFLLIAGSYTPIAVSLFPPGTRATVLWVVWLGAAVGIGLSLFWPTAPRWLYTPLYVVLGWVAVWFFEDLWRAGGPAVVWLLVAGGLSYTIGALAYGFKRPNPWPRWFGFHEIFHVGTVAGWTCICIAAYFAVLS